MEKILQRWVDGDGRIEDLETMEALFGPASAARCSAPSPTARSRRSPAPSTLFRDEFVRVIEDGSPPPAPMTPELARG